MKKITGLGWANRALSQKSRTGLDAQMLTRLADDLVASIGNANWAGTLRYPTLHMQDAIANYLYWKRENNV